MSKDVMEKFRSFVLSRHGTLYGFLKEEAEKALLYWIEASSNSSTNFHAAIADRYHSALDARTKKLLASIRQYCLIRGIVEMPIHAWRRLVAEVLERELGRKPDPRTVRRYFQLLPEAGIVEPRANGIIWRFKKEVG